MKFSLNLFLLLIVSLTLACSESDDGKDSGKNEITSKNFAGFDINIDSNNKIDLMAVDTNLTGLRVVDENGQPLAGAKVLIGSGVDSPFKGNETITDASGEVSVHKDWVGAQPVTVEAPGYVRTTYLYVMPSPQLLKVTLADGKDSLEISGETTEYGRLRKDGYIDFSLVIPALTSRNMINFDLGSVVSPESDSLTVAGRKFDLPSNISLPRQSESYIIPITFDKPKYRMSVRRSGFYKFFATHGKFPLRKVVDQMRGGASVFEIVNDFEFLGGGQKDMQVNKSTADQDISVQQVVFDQSLSVQAPAYAEDLEMISLALVNQGGYYFPSDLKRIRPNRNLNLKYPSSQAEGHVLSVLMSKSALSAQPSAYSWVESAETVKVHPLFNFSNYGQFQPLGNNVVPTSLGGLSINFTKPQAGVPVNFLSFIQPPIVNGQVLELNTPTIISDVAPKSTFVVLSEVESLPQSQFNSDKRTRMWEILTPGWAKTIELPQVALNLDPAKKYRWEVMFLGQATASPNLNGGLIEGITHVSRNSIDF